MIRSGICWVCLAALFAAPTLAEEELDVAGVYQAIVADYQRVVGATENAAGVQNEWWYHTLGCRQWLVARRNTVTNEVLETSLPEGGP